MAKEKKNLKEQAQAQVEFERYEAKYVIHKSLVAPMREFIQPFCIPDPNCTGYPPEYIITTLQLDSPTLALHDAKEKEALNRFKLRCRTYGTDGTAPVFMEIKRKCKGVVLKSRVMIPMKYWKQMFRGETPDIPFRTKHERLNYNEFMRLLHACGARPVIFIRYNRESYLSRIDSYARVTFDRRLRYSEARDWQFPNEETTKWKPMDSSVGLGRPFSGLILELKTYRDAPQWMVELTERFNLVRSGFCKYSTAVKMNTLFQGALYAEGITSNRIGI